MSSKRLLSLVVLIALLSLALSACDFGSTPATSTPTPGAGTGAGAGAGTGADIPSPTSTPVVSVTKPPAISPTTVAAIPTIIAAATAAANPGATPSGAGGGETRAVKKLSTGLEKLHSYRGQFTIAFDGTDKANNPQKGTLSFLRENNNDSKDQHVKLSSTGDLAATFGSGAGATGSGLELFHVTDNTFIVQNAKCQFTGSGDSSISNTPIFSPDDFIGSMDNAVLVAKGETINGVQANHYQVKNTKMTGSGLEGFTISQGDIWITLDDYVVKATGAATGTTRTGSKGAVTLNYNIDQINALPAIKLPADCVVPVSAADVPLPTNITEKKVVSANGATLTTFKTTDDAKTVGDFFRQKLPPQGWKVDSDQGSAFGLSLAFSKDSGKRTLTINVISAGGATTVVLTDKTAAK